MVALPLVSYAFCHTFMLVWEEVKSFTISDLLSESRKVLTDNLSHHGVCVWACILIRKKWPCVPHIAHQGNVSAPIYAPSVQYTLCPLLKTNHELTKDNFLSCLFITLSYSAALRRFKLDHSAATRMWQNASVPSCAHLFSAPVCLRPAIFDMMLLLCFTVDIVLWMSEHFANEEAWTPDRRHRRHHDTLARTCCAA